MLLWLVLGCYITGDVRDAGYDRDGDGQMSSVAGGDDCNDNDPEIYLGAFENCTDALDSDCDGLDCPLRTDIDLDAREPFATGTIGEQFGTYSELVDFTGDGVLDMVFSVPLADGGLGRVIVIPGPIDGDSIGSGDWMEIVSDDHIELHLDAVTDMFGDGSLQLVLTATRYFDGVTGGGGWASQNFHYVVTDFEPGELYTSQLDLRFTGGLWQDYEDEDERLEADYDELLIGGVDNVGDQNQLSGDDILIRVPYNFEGGGAQLYTPDAGVSAAAGNTTAFRVAPGAPFELFGDIGGRGPDINGDGIPEILLGSSDFDLPIESSTDLFYTDVGGIFIFEGGVIADQDSNDAIFRISGAYSEAPIADAASIGDTNGDGYEELGIYIRSGGGDLAIFREFDEEESQYLAQSSDVYIYGGFAADITSEFSEAMNTHDVDGDGLQDLLVSAPTEPRLEDWQATGLGAAYLFYGPVSGVQSPDHAAARWRAGVDDWVLAPPLIGDLDQDMLPDLVLPYVGDEDEEGHIYFLSDAFSGL